MMSQVPGWIRTQRATPAWDEAELLAVYDFGARNGLGGDIHSAACTIPGTSRVRELLLQKGSRGWRHRFSHKIGAS